MEFPFICIFSVRVANFPFTGCKFWGFRICLVFFSVSGGRRVRGHR